MDDNKAKICVGDHCWIELMKNNIRVASIGVNYRKYSSDGDIYDVKYYEATAVVSEIFPVNETLTKITLAVSVPQELSGDYMYSYYPVSLYVTKKEFIKVGFDNKDGKREITGTLQKVGYNYFIIGADDD